MHFSVFLDLNSLFDLEVFEARQILFCNVGQARDSKYLFLNLSVALSRDETIGVLF